MARVGRLGFLAIGTLFHFIYIYSIFDIYFVSPIVSGMRAFRVDSHEAPAKRLVLFVGDGLRADKAFQSFPDPSPPPSEEGTEAALKPRPLAPFLRSRVLEHGTFGVSHTRVPTESRPGHVALIAGLYEDVSAVMTGWKLNPVNFDSLFNRSTHTWSWGSPDILPMFKEGAVPGRIDADMYGADAEDFTQDPINLDTWVFNHTKWLFNHAKSGKHPDLDKALRQDGNVFFLHLLGLDTSGHAYRPYSKEYLHNIKVVDEGVERTTKMIEDYFGDDKTAFVFTADHGMSDWGSHGDGSPDNTRTPLIAWGSGVAGPIKTPKGTIAKGHEDRFSSDWNLDHIQRNDVAQADVAALMAYLAGLEFPVNSVGELPLQYVKGSRKEKAEALLVNAMSICEMYRVKEEKKSKNVIAYRPFSGLSGANNSTARTERIRHLIDSGEDDQIESAIQEAEMVMKLALDGMRYLQTYDWLFLRALVTVGYLGFMAFAITTVIDLHVLHGNTPESRTVASVSAFGAVQVALFAVLLVQRSAWTYYAYAVFPVVFWEEVFARRAALAKGFEVLFGKKDAAGWTVTAGKAVAFVALLEALVQSYFYREIYTVCYLLAIAWPFFYGQDFVNRNRVLVGTWSICCISMSLFTLLPVIKIESLTLINLGGLLMFGAGVLYLFFEKSILPQSQTPNSETTPKTDSLSKIILGIQVGLIPLCMIVTKSGVTNIQAKTGLPLGTQIVGWLTLIASLTVPFLHGMQPQGHYTHRLAVVNLAFAPLFIILTISYEGLFYFAFAATIICWVHLEQQVYVYTNSSAANGSTSGETSTSTQGDASRSKSVEELNPLKSGIVSATNNPPTLHNSSFRALTLADARISLFFFFFLQSGYFSVGNIASISTFSLDAVYRLIPVFDPFSQGALLMFKILAPFFLISVNLGILNRRLKVAPSALFMLVMAVSDVMTLNFFWMVRDEGSWLDIGTTITNFCIGSGLGVFVSAIEFASEAFISGVVFEERDVGNGTAELKANGQNGKVAEKKSS